MERSRDISKNRFHFWVHHKLSHTHAKFQVPWVPEPLGYDTAPGGLVRGAQYLNFEALVPRVSFKALGCPEQKQIRGPNQPP